MLSESELILSRLGLEDLAKRIVDIHQELKVRHGIEDLSFPVETIQPFRDFRERTYKLLTEAREPTSKEQKTLEERGFVFIQTEAKSLAQVIQENPGHFGEFGKVDARLKPDAYVPPSLVVAMNPAQPFIHNSWGRSQTVKLLMIDAYSQAFELEYPRATALMLPASTYAQADLEYFKKTGEKLLLNYFAHPLDQAADSDGPLVGRLAHFFPLMVLRDAFISTSMETALSGPFSVGAIPGLVLIKESYVPQRKIHPSMLV